MNEIDPRRIAITTALLVVFFVLGVGIVAYTQEKTAEQIRLNQEAVLLGQIVAVLPASHFDNNPAETAFVLPNPEQLNLGDSVLVAGVTPDAQDLAKAMRAGQVGFLATKDNQPKAVAVPVVTHRGYSGDIRLLVGVDAEQTITGVRVLQQNETPGLGDKILSSRTDWILAFDGRSLNDPASERWTVQKHGGEFDQFTGATISPRAVVEAVHQALVYVNTHYDQLFVMPSPKPDTMPIEEQANE
ncbi:MAG TPA: RnfABCDGE type electron transport complex subunit G [Halothiobacillaceae bacterium]|nr:RnfABCDGE type electron transport complex subunit G [Halothiobacillaceae bacterium]